ncbi:MULTISPECIES: tRNA (N6-threonylcarbamoyladenosine(37)-N6)-methyltransferase TrmO [Gammaproteobacteria]|uniref:tRNA (N6-threonylcarbamoyladenosine(37)-N6)-methyltransferase TrmO n=1 Tax=Gammaproteobacteria TaxID=1236 RepID=UPI000DD0223F|nr:MULTISPECIES: tRNA (N6-threonylcarbamoyladenosine(37)-N6)-methyltransferase TrmO [Gammaproteobacteria]RTE87385.1 tRNA (N6-threonylcarbamoyladenosine(37)-N6)-methyltransferase TrmO [Aliidiomarina sp. B3213]TCZ92829.1 tRNA (N6-threonylcarbamoyladenosine(37)-N6)-methyltransferase TrmO [Lysobacter sp. N42]
MNPIGIIHSPYQEKFAIPRQPGLVPSAIGRIDFYSPYNQAECFRGLEEFSHLWVQFIFHETQAKGWKPLVRPPRLGGNEKRGVFATRSTFRPNAIGLSVVKIEAINEHKGTVALSVSGIDLLDQTPILDIKPYIAYSDALPKAISGFAQESPSSDLKVEFSECAREALSTQAKHFPYLYKLIEEVLAQDPRPAYHTNQNEDRVYGMALYDFNIKWRVISNVAYVVELEHR